MESADESPGPPVAASRGLWLVRALAVACVLLLVAGFGLRWIASRASDLPPQGSHEALVRAASVVEHGPSWDWDARQAGGRFWDSLWVAANGQYDGRLLARMIVLLQVLAFGLAMSCLVRRLSPGAMFGWIAVVLAMVAARDGVDLRPSADTASSLLLLGFSCIQVWLMAGGTASPLRVVLGAACGLLNIAAAPEGVASSVAVLAWHAMAGVARLPRDRLRGPTIAVTGVLVIGGTVWTLLVHGTAPSLAGSAFPLQMMAWPFSSIILAPLVWMPALLCIVGTLRGDPRRSALAPVAVLALALSSIAAATVAPVSSSGQPLALFGMAVNAACVAAWWTTSRRSAESRLILSSAWCACLFSGLLTKPEPFASDLAGGGSQWAIVASRGAATEQAGGMPAGWNDPAVRRILPPSVREPLALVPAGGAWLGQRPNLPEPDALPAVGSWREGEVAFSGEWTSDWLETDLPLLETRISGTLRPPDTTVVLRTRDGREIKPWAGTFVSIDRWRRVMFPAPGESFQLVLRDASEDLWAAVRAPIEMGWLGWFSAKLDRWAPRVLVLACVCGCVALGLAAVQASILARSRTGPGVRDFPWKWVPWVALVGAAIYLTKNVDTTAGPNDSGGYLNSAVLLARGEVAAEPRVSFGDDVRLHTPITFRVASDGRMAPEYPPGLPLIVAGLFQLLPRDTAVAVSSVLHLILAVLVTRGLARLAGLPTGWAWLAGAIIGLSPLTWFEGLQPVSDVPALVWVTAAIYLAWASREKPWLALLAGGATALAVLIRPANILCVIPVCLCLIGHWRQLAYCACSGLPGALWLAWYQDQQYGSPWSTGYGDPSLMFGLRFFLPTVQAYARWLPEFLSPLVVLAVGGPFVGSAPRQLRIVLGVWAVLFLAFYSVYWCTWDNWYNMRFILPAAPAMVVLALLALRSLADRFRWPLFPDALHRRGLALSVALVGLVCAVYLASGTSRRILFWLGQNSGHVLAPAWAREHLPEGSVIVAKHASGSLAYYTDFPLVRMDHPAVREPGFLESIAADGRNIYAVTYHWEAFGALSAGSRGDGRPPVAGNWEQLVALWDDQVFVWRWHPVSPDRS